MAHQIDRSSAWLAAALLAGAFPLLAGAGARAQSLCSEPVPPICATEIPATDPSAAIDEGVARARCIDDAMSYKEKMTGYSRCLEGSLAEAERKLTAIDGLIQCLQNGQEHCVMEGE